ncbi:MAG: hypothetical protein KAS32_04875 [Candidatus Peribacteraceae bacterium]|nr:hypothetical protein [Candidatus Peribacteraceae bacterium]
MKEHKLFLGSKSWLMGNPWNAVLLGILVAFFLAALSIGIDRTIENQDIMLCESALISGNKKYLKSCECYYETEDIKCLQK